MMRIFTLCGVAQTVQTGSAVILPKPLNIPDGAKVCSVQSNYNQQCFDFVIEHETFAEVKDCVDLPVVRMELQLFTVGRLDEADERFMPAAEPQPLTGDGL